MRWIRKGQSRLRRRGTLHKRYAVIIHVPLQLIELDSRLDALPRAPFPISRVGRPSRITGCGDVTWEPNRRTAETSTANALYDEPLNVRLPPLLSACRSSTLGGSLHASSAKRLDWWPTLASLGRLCCYGRICDLHRPSRQDRSGSGIELTRTASRCDDPTTAADETGDDGATAPVRRARSEPGRWKRAATRRGRHPSRAGGAKRRRGSPDVVMPPGDAPR